MNSFAKIEVCVSAPTVAFRETIVCPPLVDRVNEAVVGGKKVGVHVFRWGGVCA